MQRATGSPPENVKSALLLKGTILLIESQVSGFVFVHARLAGGMCAVLHISRGYTYHRTFPQRPPLGLRKVAIVGVIMWTL